MKKRFNFTIARRLTLGFGILALAVLTSNYFTYRTVHKNQQANQLHTDVYAPSAAYLNDLYSLISNSKMLIKNWVFIDKKEETPGKKALKQLHSTQYPHLIKAMSPMVEKWPKKNQKDFEQITLMIDTLFEEHQEIMQKLNTFESYSDPMVLFSVQDKVSDKGEVINLTNRILKKIDNLDSRLESVVNESNKEMQESFSRLKNIIYLTGGLMLLAVFIIALITTRNLVIPLRKMRRILLSMSRGVLPKERLKYRSDEIGEMSSGLNQLIDGLQQTSEFSLQIGKGNFSHDFKPLSEEDVLGNSLLMMRDNLKQAAEEQERRKREDQQRNWATQGIAKFGEILRQNNDDLEELSYHVISELVKYLDANQGGLFILNDEDKDNVFIELKAAYAYNRRKYLERKIEVGVSIVGQVVQEAESVYMTDIPDNYIRITSGLGDENPTSLLVVPLKLNEKVYGVVEIASFKEFEKYQIDFIEKISETIASTISNVKITQNTARLLKESQEISEQMAQQEEEMRQNMEEMQATQEEMENRQKDERKRMNELKSEYKSQVNELQKRIQDQQQELDTLNNRLETNLYAVNNSIGTYELTMDGKYITANSKFLKITDTTMDDIKGTKLDKYMSDDITSSNAYELFWSKLKSGKSQMGGHQYYFKGKEKWLYETFTPVKDENGEYTKIVVLATDISKVREKEKQFEIEIENLNMKLENAYKELDDANREIERLNE